MDSPVASSPSAPVVDQAHDPRPAVRSDVLLNGMPVLIARAIVQAVAGGAGPMPAKRQHAR